MKNGMPLPTLSGVLNAPQASLAFRWTMRILPHLDRLLEAAHRRPGGIRAVARCWKGISGDPTGKIWPIGAVSYARRRGPGGRRGCFYDPNLRAWNGLAALDVHS